MAKKITIISTDRMSISIDMAFAKTLFGDLNLGLAKEMSWSEIQEAYEGKENAEKELRALFREAGERIGARLKGNKFISKKRERATG